MAMLEYEVLKGKHKGKIRKTKICYKCHYLWVTTMTSRPPICPNCQDKNWDRPYKNKPAYEISQGHSITAEGESE